nr:MAG TPA: hypothetical protein [Caudoviricetes sp.]
MVRTACHMHHQSKELTFYVSSFFVNIFLLAFYISF